MGGWKEFTGFKYIFMCSGSEVLRNKHSSDQLQVTDTVGTRGQVAGRTKRRSGRDEVTEDSRGVGRIGCERESLYMFHRTAMDA